MELMEPEIETSTNMYLLEISIDSDLTLTDFATLLSFTNRVVQVINNVNIVLKDPVKLNKVYAWSKASAEIKYDINANENIIERTRSDFFELKNASINNLSSEFEIYENNILAMSHFLALDKQASYLFGTNNIPVKVSSINYNSPGEIITELPKVLAEQTNDLLNTILFYNKRKTQFELNNQLKKLELNEKTKDYERKLHLEDINSVVDDLTQAVIIVNKLGELKDALQKIGATEKESTEFVKRWLLDRIDTVFPVLDKVRNIDLLT